MNCKIKFSRILLGTFFGTIVLGIDAASFSKTHVVHRHPAVDSELSGARTYNNDHTAEKRSLQIGSYWSSGFQSNLNHRQTNGNSNSRFHFGNGPPIVDNHRLSSSNGPQIIGNNRPQPGNGWNHRPPFGNAWNHRPPFGNGLSHQGGQRVHFGNGVHQVGNHRPPFGGGANHNSHNRPNPHGGLNAHAERHSSAQPPTDTTPASSAKTPGYPAAPKLDIPPGLGNLRESYAAWWQVFQSKLKGCGQGHESPFHSNLRVIGGRFGTIEAWPWMVSMYSVLIRQPLCAGTLVADSWVVTAAHCFNGPFANPTFWTLHFGKVNSSGAAEYEREQVRTIEHVFINSAYNEFAKLFSFDGDIALVKLDKPVEFTDTTSPLCLVRKPDNLAAMELKCKITGYGISNLTNVHQGINVLHVAGVPLVDKKTCAAIDGYGDKITDNMICAGRAGGGVDTCKGDSGGPLQCKLDGKWNLVGVTSWGGKTYRECAEPGQPGVYTDVSKYTPWIYTHIYLDYIQDKLASKQN